MTVEGTCDERFTELGSLLEKSVESGNDLGGSVAVAVDGEMVVDIWDGWADEARSRPWERDTITNVWSTTKTMTALAALVLVERGELDLFAPVAEYWPEFGASGKDHVEVRHLLSHTSGVAGWAQPVEIAACTTRRGRWRSSPGRRRGGSPVPRPATTASTRGTSSER